ncbi:MAG: prepilin-type N-terminal cleavage/methylation domain-containing protein [Proteobacteria bacterium]|nr:prepilin-type N-terminal cleavage/methylation domain-containing protein [Pseudomonadota bacterium]
MKNPGPQSGFTLIEVMLALALTGMLLGLLSTGVYIVAEDWNRNSDRLDANLDDAVAILQIDRALQGAFPHSYTNEDTLTRQLYFSGEDDFVSWVSAVSPQRTPGLTAWELFNVDDEGVYLALAPAYSDNPAQRLSRSEPRLILPGYSVQFSYLYAELDESKRWRDDWEAEEFLGLPLAVYVRFEPDDRDREVLEIVARIRNNEHRSIRPNTGLQQGL